MPIRKRRSHHPETLEVRPQFTQGGELMHVPRLEIPQDEMPAETAYQIVHDELMLDGNARLNLATFVTTWMEPAARLLMAECLDKNMIDKDEYPQTAELERRCVAMLADLWNAPARAGVGCSTMGSSEACMLGALALKRRWQHARRAAGKAADRPNLVLGINAQICWDKFCTYFEVEPRFVPMEGARFHLGVPVAVALCEENTIGVVAILGSTFDGSYEPVAEPRGGARRPPRAHRSRRPHPRRRRVGSDGRAISGPGPGLGLPARARRVGQYVGHKYGRVYPGVGWVVWRDETGLPDDLVFRVNYLGGDMPTFAINFSRPGAQVIAQYYEFIRLGREGYRAVQQSCRDAATWLASRLGTLRNSSGRV